MKHLHLSISGALASKELAPRIYAGLQLPAWEWLLGRGGRAVAVAETMEDFLCEAFGAGAVAPVRAAADGLAVQEDFWACADPVHLQFQAAQAVLQPIQECGADEAQALCDTLNGHFAGDGVRFLVPHPQRWYLHSADSFEIAATPLSAVWGGDVKAYLPQGRDALRWQRLSNEIQMLLHGHVVNQERERRGLPVINSLWLWGGGHGGSLRRVFGAMGGDELARIFAQASRGQAMDTLPQLLASGAESGLWIERTPELLWRTGDLHGWRAALEVLEREVMQPVSRALRSGALQQLTLDLLAGESGWRFSLSHGDRWKCWRRLRPLHDCAV